MIDLKEFLRQKSVELSLFTIPLLRRLKWDNETDLYITRRTIRPYFFNDSWGKIQLEKFLDDYFNKTTRISISSDQKRHGSIFPAFYFNRGEVIDFQGFDTIFPIASRYYFAQRQINNAKFGDKIHPDAKTQLQGKWYQKGTLSLRHNERSRVILEAFLQKPQQI